MNKLLKIGLGGVINQDIEDLLADSTDLASLSIGGRLGTLVLLLLGESNSEDTKSVTISGSHIDVSCDYRLPLADKGVKLIAGHVHAIEVGKDVVTLDIFSDKSDLAVALGFITTVKISKIDFEDTTLQFIRGDLDTSSLVDNGLAGNSLGEERWGTDIV